MPFMKGNPMRRTTVYDRMKAGLGAVGPNHPNVRASMLKPILAPSAAAAPDEPEPDDNPSEEGAEGAEGAQGPPNLREAEECGLCAHYDGADCTLYSVPVEEEQTCDSFERSDNPDMEERQQKSDQLQNADQSGDY